MGDGFAGDDGLVEGAGGRLKSKEMPSVSPPVTWT